METLKNWVKSKPFLVVVAALAIATIAYSLFFGSADVPV
jgi:hypothetical protein